MKIPSLFSRGEIVPSPLGEREVMRGGFSGVFPPMGIGGKRRLLEMPTQQNYESTVCGYIYDPKKGDPDSDIEPGTFFEDLPDDWVCPVCGASKSEFEPVK